jgi:7-carboxy-7-deazaguanine synthase
MPAQMATAPQTDGPFVTYTVKEIYRTIQGEGALTGRVAVFCRFAGCNLWSGREQDRSTAVCKFCDTGFIGGDKYETAERLAQTIEATWGTLIMPNRMVVLTGGEPALQFDAALKAELRKRHFYIAMETNGTVELKADPDWVCISPKAGTTLKELTANELKVVFPQDGLDPESVGVLAPIKSLQPMDIAGNRMLNTQLAIAYCLAHPKWRLSQQTHKWAGIP